MKMRCQNAKLFLREPLSQVNLPTAYASPGALHRRAARTFRVRTVVVMLQALHLSGRDKRKSRSEGGPIV